MFTPILCDVCWTRAGISTIFFCKGKDSNYFQLCRLHDLVTATQLYFCNTKVATDKMYMNGSGCVPIKLYLQRQVVGQIWPQGYSLPTLV